jgi:virulence-associated protein VagC
MTTIQIFQTGDGQVVRLPAGYEFASTEIAIRREGDAVILEPIKSGQWPENFFERIHIDDAAFRRPEQGAMPAAPEIELP